MRIKFGTCKCATAKVRKHNTPIIINISDNIIIKDDKEYRGDVTLVCSTIDTNVIKNPVSSDSKFTNFAAFRIIFGEESHTLSNAILADSTVYGSKEQLKTLEEDKLIIEEIVRFLETYKEKINIDILI